MPKQATIDSPTLLWPPALRRPASPPKLVYEREQSTTDFYAGLAFATAVSAAIAALQELPFKRAE